LCLVVIAWRARDDLPLIVAANRDEWRDRPAEPARWWDGEPRMLAGRDLQAGGTWMGVTAGGRFAAVTNFRDPAERRSDAISRGGLVTAYLRADQPPESFLAALAPRASEYNGFNLILGDAGSLWYFSSRDGAARPIAPGVHALSNHLLDEPWPKVVTARCAMSAALLDADPAARLFDALSDVAAPTDAALPDTGVGLAWERRLASALITGADYGTRCSTVAAFDAGGGGRFEERTRAADGSVSVVVRYFFARATSAASSSPVL
jgi:uncharacterized protein with NRDE domain